MVAAAMAEAVAGKWLSLRRLSYALQNWESHPFLYSNFFIRSGSFGGGGGGGGAGNFGGAW